MYAWFYDTQMLNADPFVAMAAAAMHTTRIRYGQESMLEEWADVLAGV